MMASSESLPLLPFPRNSPLFTAFQELQSSKSKPKRPRRKDNVARGSARPVWSSYAMLGDVDVANTQSDDVRSSRFVSRLLNRNLPSGLLDRDDPNSLTNSKQLAAVVGDLQKVSICFDEVAQQVSQHRAQVGRVLTKIQSSYVTVFERMLGVLVEAHRRRERAARRSKRLLCDQLNTSEAEVGKFRRRIQELIDVQAAKESVVRVLEERVAELETEVQRMRALLRDGTRDIIPKPSLEPSAEPTIVPDESHSSTSDSDDETVDGGIDEELMSSLSGMEHALRDAEDQGLGHAQLLHNLGRLLRLAASRAPHHAREGAGIEIAGENGVAAKVDLSKFKPVVSVSDASTVTAVDEEGLWEVDASDRVLEATRGMSWKVLWWRAFNFARCPQCRNSLGARSISHGADGNGAESAAEVKDEVHTTKGSSARRRNRRRSTVKSASANGLQGRFVIPPGIQSFLANLPRTVQGVKIKSLAWVTDSIDTLYDAKCAADSADLADGLPLQPLWSFVTEQLLLKYGLRRLAELHCYELLMAVKSHRAGNKRVQMFAHFLGLVECDDESNQMNDLNLLNVYLSSRRLLLPSATPGPGPNTSGVATYNEVRKAIVRQDHQTFVPLTHAVEVVRHVLGSFLPARKLKTHCSKVESLARINELGPKSRGVRPPEGLAGDRMKVRIRMRQAMLIKTAVRSEKSPATGANASGSSSKGQQTSATNLTAVDSEGVSSWENEDSSISDGPFVGRNSTVAEEEASDWQSREQVVVDADETLGIIAEVVLMRRRHIQDQLRRMFVKGDTNGDGVLSFQEFCDIVSRASPRLSQRKILRMFQECYSGDTLSMSPEVFCDVCTRYAIVPLIDSVVFEAFINTDDPGDTVDKMRAVAFNAQLANAANPAGPKVRSRVRDR